MALLQRSLALFAMAMAASLSFTCAQHPLAAPGARYRDTVVCVGYGDTLRVQAGGRTIR